MGREQKKSYAQTFFFGLLGLELDLDHEGSLEFPNSH